MTYAVDLPDMPPLSMNARHGHWAQRHATVKAWRDAAAWSVKAASVPAMERVAVELHVTPPDRRRRDRHNLHATLKPVLDGGLVDAGVIRDDTPEHLASEKVVLHPPDGVRRWRWRLEIRDASREGAA